MAFQKFKEYLNDKGNLQNTPIVDPEADTGPKGNKPVRPEKAVTKGKNWKNFARSEAAQVADGGNGAENLPYAAPGTDPGQLTADGGKGGKAGKSSSSPLGDKGEKDLIYKPKTTDQRLKMKKMNDTTPEPTKTEQFLNATRNLTPDAYAEFILQRNNSKGMKQVIETVEIINNDELLIETLVREMKRRGSLLQLVDSVLDQPESFSGVADRLAGDKDSSRKLARAMNEITAEPATDDIVKEKPASKRMPPKDDSINSAGHPVEPPMNARKAKTVKDIPLSPNDNIMMSKKQYVMMRPEHHLIEALASYKSIKATMKKVVD